MIPKFKVRLTGVKLDLLKCTVKIVFEARLVEGAGAAEYEALQSKDKMLGILSFDTTQPSLFPGEG